MARRTTSLGMLIAFFSFLSQTSSQSNLKRRFEWHANNYCTTSQVPRPCAGYIGDSHAFACPGSNVAHALVFSRTQRRTGSSPNLRDNSRIRSSLGKLPNVALSQSSRPCCLCRTLTRRWKSAWPQKNHWKWNERVCCFNFDLYLGYIFIF